VVSDLLESEARLRVIREEAENEILEVVTETSAVDFLEISVCLALEQ
jgi:hypothetical protein